MTPHPAPGVCPGLSRFPEDTTVDKVEKRLAKLLGDAGLALEGLEADAKRGRGRPRTRAAGVRKRAWYATDAEIAALRAEADAAGVSVEELVRRRALRLRKNATTRG